MNKFLEAKRDEMAKLWANARWGKFSSANSNEHIWSDQAHRDGFRSCHELYAPLVEAVKYYVSPNVYGVKTVEAYRKLHEALRAVGEIE